MECIEKMANDALLNAKKVKNDEFYTLYEYIQKEVNAYLEYNPDVFKNKTVFLPCDDPEWSNFTKFFAQNFQRFGLKKLISTSYAYNSKNVKFDYQPTLFETVDPRFEITKSRSKGKIFTLTSDENKDGKVNIEDLKWDYLEGDGDFRSAEIKKIRDEADFIITNPPFSLFREFVAWILEADKKCLIIGQIGMATYKEIFKEIKNNRLWIGVTANSEDMVFMVPEGAEVNPKDREKAERMGYKGNYTRQGNACWFTNIDHGRRHAPLSLMTMADNIKFSRHKDLKENGYLNYFNYDGIDVPYVDAIPSDYDGVMGVPTSFLDKYNPTQFEIIDNGAYAPKTMIHTVVGDTIQYIKDGNCVWSTPYTVSERKAGNGLRLNENGLPGALPYGRILIRRKQ